MSEKSGPWISLGVRVLGSSRASKILVSPDLVVWMFVGLGGTNSKIETGGDGGNMYRIKASARC